MSLVKNNNCPLTASTDCIKWQLFQIFTCLYRKCPMLWCHLWPHQVRSTCAKLQGFWLVRLCCPCGSHDHCLFSLTLIGLGRSYDLNKKPLQFSTWLSSSGGIFFKRMWLFLLGLIWNLIEGTWVPYVI